MTVMQVMVLARSAKVTVTATETDTVRAPHGRIEGHGDSLIVHGGSDTLDVEVPLGSDICIATSSGKVRCCGSLGSVSVTSASGKVVVERASAAEIRTASGSIDIGIVDGTVGILTKSGTVEVDSAQRANVTTVSGKITIDSVQHAEVNTVSGWVRLATRSKPTVKVRGVSANIDVSVARDFAPSASLVSITGKVRCDCATGNDGEITIKTVSGGISVVSGG